MAIRLPFQKRKKVSIAMPVYTPGTGNLEGMTKGGKFRPVREYKPGSDPFNEQLKQRVRMRQQAARMKQNRAG